MPTRNQVVDYSRSQQQKRATLIPPSSSQTQSSNEKSTRETRSSEGNTNVKHHEKDKGVNVQVILRCRPLIEDEVKVKTPVAISCNEFKGEVTAFQNVGSNKQIGKTFVFDKVFGPNCKQKDLYDQAIAPIVNEALEGYNCTIFAYGQTGTGKTYTMQGEGTKHKNGGFCRDAGVIPRAAQQIFDILEAQNAEYSLKVTFIELYNEEVSDLLAPDEGQKYGDDKTKKPIALMEDAKGVVFVRGLEEEIVCSADEIYKILEKGTSKKHISETLLNRQSNRSHSLFTITIHVKECTSDGVEVIKCGKLNLVDLAGSENILRSGAKEGRAREAGEINKSLLTLGRVINALVEHSGHVPYRDSKLTRLLRDSLGGKTKTCIIATVSPSAYSMEETLNSLDYAYRAKNIKNRPEVNQKVVKSAMIKDLHTEIDRLKQELNVTREKNGVYIPHERYLSEEAAKKAMTDKLERMELDLEFKDKQLMELQELYIYQQQLTENLNQKFLSTQAQLEESRQSFFDLEDKYRQANDTIKEKEYLIFNLLGSEKALTERAIELQAELENAASDLSKLFAKIENKNKMEDGNKALIHNFHKQLVQQLQLLHNAVESSVEQHQQQLKVIEEKTQSFVPKKDKATEGLRAQLKTLKDTYGCGIKLLVDLAGELDGSSQLTFGNIKSESLQHSSYLMDLIKEISSEADLILHDLQSNLHNQEKSVVVFLEQQHENCTRTYQATQSVSRITVDFIKMLSIYISKLTLIVEEAQTIDLQKLGAFEKNYEDYADCEERQLLNMVAELLARSNARKKKLVQTAADDLRDSSTSRTNKLQQEMSNMKTCTSAAREEWTSYLKEVEKHYIEDTTALERGQDNMDNGLKLCLMKARMISERWRQAYESLVSQQRNNIESIDSIIQNGRESNQATHAQLTSIVSSTLEEADNVDDSSLSYLEYLLRLDHDESRKISSLLVEACQENLRGLESAHSEKIVEISEIAEKCLINEYSVEESSCSTLMKRSFNLPSTASVEELRTPAFEELLRLFRKADSKEKINGYGNVHNTTGVLEATLESLDSTLPFNC